MDTESRPDLRTVLQNLCVEYQGLHYIVKHYIRDENPAALLRNYCSLEASKSQVARLLDEASEDLQSLPTDRLAHALVEVMFHTR